jgi:hypothetical protein
MMNEKKSVSPLQIGLLTVTAIWFLFSFHELFKAMVNINEYLYFGGGQSAAAWWVMVTDYSGAVGLIARTAAGIVAVAAVALYLKKGIASGSTRKVLQFILVAEAIYWLSLLLSGIWGLLPIEWAYGVGPGAPTGLHWSAGFVIETGLPCIVESIMAPIVLLKLVYELRPSRPPKNAIKWALIAGFAYIFVFWLDNTGNWIYQAFYSRKPIEYLTTNPVNILNLILTTVGLLAIGIYAAYYAKKSAGTESIDKLKLRPLGAIITLVGLYFLWNYLTWIFFGNNALWSDWFAWFLGHNMDLWVLAIPMVGLPLLLSQKPSEKTESTET